MDKTTSMDEIWTKVPHIIKYEYGLTWLGVLFLILLSYKSLEQYLIYQKIIMIITFILSSLFFLILIYKRFIKTTAVLLSDKGILVYPIFRKCYFVPWDHIEKFIMTSTCAGGPICIKKILFIYKKEFSKNKFFKTKQLPIIAHHNANFKRLKMTFEKYS